jgi:hypothetical protein
MVPMKLTIGPSTEIVNPTKQQVLDALAGLTEDADSFVILGETEQHYIQTRKTEYGYALEYREGGHDSHYKSQTTVTLATLSEAFLHYLSKSPHYKDVVEYEPYVAPARKGCLLVLVSVLLPLLPFFVIPWAK